jgi:hypothetical protein
MSVQDVFFLPRDLYEDSILNQGVEGAAGDPQVIGGSSLTGGHQGLAAGSGWNIGGQGQPPPNIGHVPSHVSIATHATAATSVVATSGYFIGTTCQSVAEINARRVICPKSAHGVLGSRDYTCHQEAATKALPHVFASAINSFMPRMQRENLPTRTLTSSPNMPVILPRSRILNVIWTHGICQIPLSFLCSSTLMLYQWKIAGQKGSRQECTY